MKTEAINYYSHVSNDLFELFKIKITLFNNKKIRM